MYLSDYIRCFIKAFIITGFFVLITFLGLILINFNFMIGTLYCDWLKVPYDLALTYNSPGMKNEVIIILSAFEIGLFCYAVNKLSKITFICNILNYFAY